MDPTLHAGTHGWGELGALGLDLQLGEEDHVHNFADWFIQKIRARPNKLEHMRMFWESSGWRIAMGMRAGQAFGDVSNEVMADVDLLNETMSREAPRENKPNLPKKRVAQDDNGPPSQRPKTTPGWNHQSTSKGSKGNQKGKPQNYQWHSSQTWKSGTWQQQHHGDHSGGQGYDPSQGR